MLVICKKLASWQVLSVVVVKEADLPSDVWCLQMMQNLHLMLQFIFSLLCAVYMHVCKGPNL